MNLILIQMFIAILDGHYIDYENENGTNCKDKMDFLAWFLILLREECGKIHMEVKNVVLSFFFFKFMFIVEEKRNA